MCDRANSQVELREKVVGMHKAERKQHKGRVTTKAISGFVRSVEASAMRMELEHLHAQRVNAGEVKCAKLESNMDSSAEIETFMIENMNGKLSGRAKTLVLESAVLDASTRVDFAVVHVVCVGDKLELVAENIEGFELEGHGLLYTHKIPRPVIVAWFGNACKQNDDAAFGDTEPMSWGLSVELENKKFPGLQPEIGQQFSAFASSNRLIQCIKNDRLCVRAFAAHGQMLHATISVMCLQNTSEFVLDES